MTLVRVKKISSHMQEAIHSTSTKFSEIIFAKSQRDPTVEYDSIDSSQFSASVYSGSKDSTFSTLFVIFS